MEGVPLDNQVGLKVLNVSHNQVSSFIFVNWTELLRVSNHEFYTFFHFTPIQLTFRKLDSFEKLPYEGMYKVHFA